MRLTPPKKRSSKKVVKKSAYSLPTGYKIVSVSTVPKNHKAFVFGYNKGLGRAYMFIFDRDYSYENHVYIISIMP